MILADDIDGRMLRIIQQHYGAGHAMNYIPHVHTLTFRWQVPPNASGNGGYEERSVCQLGKWFTPEAQDYIIDLIYPRL